FLRSGGRCRRSRHSTGRKDHCGGLGTKRIIRKRSGNRTDPSVKVVHVGLRSIDLDAVLADDGEGIQHVGGAEEDANLFAQVHELEIAACGTGGDVEPSESAEAHAVHANEIGQVEDDALVVQQRLDLAVEDVTDTGHEFAVASYDDGAGIVVDVQGEGGWS